MPVRLGREHLRLGLAVEIEQHAEIAGPAAEHDAAARDRIDGDVVAAIGDRDLAQDSAVRSKKNDSISAVGRAAGRHERRRTGRLRITR